MNMIRAAARAGSGEPSPASSTRHACIVMTMATSTLSRAAATVPNPRSPSAARTLVHSRATA